MSSLPTPSLAKTEVIVAMLSPCVRPGEVDPVSMQRLSAELSLQGCDGLFVLGSTGEMILVDETSRRELVAAARQGAAPETAILVGVGGFSPRQVLRLARDAQADGAQAVVVMAPFFQKVSQPELIAYVEQIAEESPLPVGFYHHLRMPTAFEVETVATLAQHPNIQFCKDTSGDLDRMQQLVAATAGSGLRLYQGSESLFLPSLQMGATGCVCALACVVPAWHRALLSAYRAGDVAEAAEYQEKIDQLMALFRLPAIKESLTNFVHTLKQATWQQGMISSPASLLPGFVPTAEFDQQIAEILQAAGLIDESTQRLLRFDSESLPSQNCYFYFT